MKSSLLKSVFWLFIQTYLFFIVFCLLFLFFGLICLFCFINSVRGAISAKLVILTIIMIMSFHGNRGVWLQCYFLFCRSWGFWWTTMTAAIYFRSSQSQFRIGPLCSWKSFRDITTRWGQHWYPVRHLVSTLQDLAIKHWLKSMIYPQGFGAGNFKSLFEAIEADQHARGNLTVLTPNGVSKNIWSQYSNHLTFKLQYKKITFWSTLY